MDCISSSLLDNALQGWLLTVAMLQFITNVVFIPYMALREQPAASASTSSAPQASPEAVSRLPYYAKYMGGVSAFIGIVSIGWALAGRPEFGSVADRWDWLVTAFTTNRVFYAFTLDLALYTVWQVLFLEGAERKFRFVPFAGLAAWLIAGGPRTKRA